MAATLYGPQRAATRPRILLGLVLLTAAMPIRFGVSTTGFDSVSLLDVVLGVAAVSLVLGCAVKPLDVGYRQLFALLCIPLFICGMSMLWTQDRGATFRATLVYAEGAIAYLFVVRELGGADPDRVIRYIRRFSCLLIIPAVLLLLRVPGFGPEETWASVGSDRYRSYYTRLSHPVLGPSNNLASVLALFVPILLYWGHTRHDRRSTVAGYIALVAVVCTLSRGVVAALLIAAVLAGLGHLVRMRQVGSRVLGKILVAVVTAVVALVALYQLNPDTHEFFGSRFSPANVVIRTEFILDAADKIADRPVLGYGAGAAPGGIEDLARVHNTYLQQALNYGLLLGAFVSLMLIGLALFFFSRWRTAPAARVVGFTLIAQLVVFAVESSFEGTVLRVLFYLSVGLLTALVRACEVRPEPPPKSDPVDTAELALEPLTTPVGTAVMRHELIICTRNRAGDLRRCLGSVAVQTAPPDRLIVVDSSDTDATARDVKVFAGKTGLAVQYLRTARGLTLQRNAGLDQVSAATDVVHFIDDDTVLAPDYLREVLMVFRSRPDVGGVGGRDARLPDPEPPWYRRVFLLNSRRQGALLPSGVNVLSATGHEERRPDWLSGCSMSYCCRSITGLRFDEGRRGNGIADDVDFSARVAARAPLVWTPLAVLDHHMSPANRDNEAVTLRRTIRSRWRLARDHVGRVNRIAVIYGVLGEFLISALLAVRHRSGFYARLARACVGGAVDIVRKVPV